MPGGLDGAEGHGVDECWELRALLSQQDGVPRWYTLQEYGLGAGDCMRSAEMIRPDSLYRKTGRIGTAG